MTKERVKQIEKDFIDIEKHFELLTGRRKDNLTERYISVYASLITIFSDVENFSELRDFYNTYLDKGLKGIEGAIND